MGQCGVCQSAICEKCAQAHNDHHESNPLGLVASYLDRGAEVASGLAFGARAIESHVHKMAGLLGFRIGKKRRRPAKP